MTPRGADHPIPRARPFQFLEIRASHRNDRHWHGRGRVYLTDHAGHKGIKVAPIAISGLARHRDPRQMAQSGGCQGTYLKASILKAGRVVFSIKGNDYRL
jgi:hypothetical protein